MAAEPILDMTSEIPVTEIPSEPHWSENYCFDGYDGNNNIGFWLHLGRWPRDPTIWREQLWVYWPDGTYTVMRGFGAHPVRQGAGGALLRLSCIEPGNWRIRFKGPTRVSSAQRMASDASSYLSDGPYAAIDVDLAFYATHPVWNFGDVLKNENWCHFHYEQHGGVRGTLKFRAPGREWQMFEMQGVGYRDHSRGPRELSTFGGNYWINGQFPNGRAFSLMHVWKIVDGDRVPAFSKAVVFESGAMYPATFDSVPLIKDRHHPDEHYQLIVNSELGVMSIRAQVKRSVCQSADSCMDSFDGIGNSREGVLYVYEQPTQFTWNGNLGMGHTERAERS